MKKFEKMIAVAVFFVLAVPVFVFAESYDVYVDASNDSGTEDGSQAHPYNTITEGITAAMSNDEDDRKVYVADGEYREQVTIDEEVELYGESKSDTVIYGKDNSNDEFSWTVKMKHKSKIKDFKIKYGETGIFVEEDAKATIEDCKIKDFDEIGIEVESADRNDKKLLTVEDCEIYDGDGKAMYIRKRKISIKDNEIYDNDEEGIDLRSKVKGKIYDNEIYDNGESGIEFEMRKAKLKIKDNDIDDNSGSGINAQYRGKNKSAKYVIVEDNEITQNSDFGLRCSRPQGGNPPLDYFSSPFTLMDNVFEGNEAGMFSQMCRM